MTVRKGFAIFTIMAVSMSAAVLFYSVDASTFRVLLHASKEKIALAAALVVLAWCLDAVKLKLITSAAGERVSFKLSILLVWLNYFGCAITPLQSGGGPFQIYVLYKNGVAVGKGIAITLVRTLLTLFVMGLAFPITMVLYPDILSGHSYVKGFVTYVMLFLVMMWAVITVSLVRPSMIKRVAGWGALMLKRFGFIKPKRVLRVVRRVSREIDTYNDNIRMFCLTGKLQLLAAVFVTMAHILVQMSVLPCLIWSIDLPVNVGKAIILQALFTFFLYFVPTPGGSGIAEGGAAAVFQLLVPKNISGVMAVSWRFFTEYTGIVMGTLVALKYLGWDLAEQLMQDVKKDNPE